MHITNRSVSVVVTAGKNSLRKLSILKKNNKIRALHSILCTSRADFISASQNGNFSNSIVAEPDPKSE